MITTAFGGSATPQWSTTYRCRVLRRLRFALCPGWLALHVVTFAAAVTMVFLGRWQLHVSESKHFSVQNFGYALQWWLFAAFALAMWARVLRDTARRNGAPPVDTGHAQAVAALTEPVAYRRYVMPTAHLPTGDPVHGAYNDYLAHLAAEDAESR